MGSVTVLPFRDALGLTALGAGSYRAEIGSAWLVGPKPLGSLLLVLAVRAAQQRLLDEGAPGPHDPLAIGAEFLRAPGAGPVELHTELLKTGATTSVVAVRMHQDGDIPPATHPGRIALAATVTTGRLPDDAAVFSDLPELPVTPPDHALDPALDAPPGVIRTLAISCELRLDPDSMAFARGAAGPPVMRGWVRPRGEDPDPLFALLVGDILPPTVFNVAGRTGWAPTVQLTALLRARPVPGWLRVQSRATAVVGTWFDEDATVIDAAGRLICQARQLALSPLVTDRP